MKPRRAQEDHAHAVVTATVDGSAPPGGDADNYLDDSPGWSNNFGNGLPSPPGLLYRWFYSTGQAANSFGWTVSTNGTGTVNPTVNVDTGDAITRRLRVKYARANTGVAGASVSTEYFSTTRGFTARFVFGSEAWTADDRAFAGFFNVTNPTLTADVTDGTTYGVVGICMDMGGTEWQWVHSEDTTVTSSSTGLAITSGQLLCLDIKTLPDAAGFRMRLRDLGAGTSDEYDADSNYPDSVTLGDGSNPFTLAPGVLIRRDGSASGAAEIHVVEMITGERVDSPW